MEAIWFLSGLLVFVQILDFVERRRLINCIMSKNYGELVQAEMLKKPAKPKAPHFQLPDDQDEVSTLNQLL